MTDTLPYNPSPINLFRLDHKAARSCEIEVKTTELKSGQCVMNNMCRVGTRGYFTQVLRLDGRSTSHSDDQYIDIHLG